MKHGIQILHVDDDPDFANLVATVLEEEEDRFAVETATSPTDGYNRIEEGSYDCIISDYNMPGQTGIEFLEAVREEHPDLPFILFTGKGSEAVAADAISAGVTDYLQKETGTGQYTVLANQVLNAVERYRTDLEAERTRRQLEAIADNSPDAILTIDTESRIHFVSAAVEDLFGYTPGELHGKRLTKLMPDRLRESHLAGVERYLETGERSLEWSDIEFQARQKDGSEIPISISFGEFLQYGERRFIGIVRDISKRVQLEEHAREQETLFRQVTENIKEVVWMSDPDKEEILYVNPAYEAVWGRSMETLYENPTSFLEAIHPDDRDRVEAALGAQASGTYEEEYRIIRPNGEQRWVRDRAVPIENDAGVVSRIVGVASDITTQKEYVQQREQIIERVTDAIVEVDADWRFTLLNEQAEELYDMSEESLLGRDFWEVFEAAKGTRFEEEYRAVMDEREPTSFVEYFSQLEGWFDITAYPKDDGGIAFYFVEVTERREREEALEAERRFVSEALDALDDAFYVLGPDGELQRWNERVPAVTGYSEAELTDMGITELFPENERERIAASIETTLETGDDRVEGSVSTRDGTRIPYEFVSRRLTGTDGDLIGIAGIGRDISDRKEHERELERHVERLDEFAGVVSHDLRNPLNVAEGRLQMVQDECDSDHVEPIGRALDRMNRIVDDLLWLAREGHDIGATDAVDVRTAVEDAWEMVADDVEKATLQFEDDVSGHPPIKADFDRLCQLLENLLRNAIEHGGREVTVTVDVTDGGFSVEDDGPGIPTNHWDEVFRAGYSTREKGTGFGLAIVRRVAEAHGWSVSVADGVDGGARFEITDVEFVA